MVLFSALLAIALAAWTLNNAFTAFSHGLVARCFFFALVAYYVFLPAAFALSIEGPRWYRELGEWDVVPTLLFGLLCVVGFSSGYATKGGHPFYRAREGQPVANLRSIVIACYLSWLLGLYYIGAFNLGAIWQTDWLLSAAVAGQSEFGPTGYTNAVTQACLVVGPFALIWARRRALLLCVPLAVLQLLFAVASGGRWVLASLVVAAGVRLILASFDRAQLASRGGATLPNHSLGFRVKLFLLLAVGLLVASYLLSLIGYLRNYRGGDLLSTLTSTETYTDFASAQTTDAPWYLTWADGVWVYAFYVYRDVPDLIPIQPGRIGLDVVSALLPGYRRFVGGRDTIEQDLAQIYFGTTFRSATVHPTYLGILFIFWGWFGVALTFILGLAFRWLDDAVLLDVHSHRRAFWVGTVGTACYWSVFFVRGALQFSIFRAYWAFGYWILLYAALAALANLRGSKPTNSQAWQ